MYHFLHQSVFMIFSKKAAIYDSIVIRQKDVQVIGWFHIDPEIKNTRHVEIDISER